MSVPAPSINPDDKPIYAALREAGVSEDIAYTAVQRIRDVAAANLIAQLLNRFDSQAAAQNAKLDALQEQIRRERTMLWAVIALLGAAVMRYLVAG